MAPSARGVLPSGVGEAQSAIRWGGQDPPVRVHSSNIDLDSTVNVEVESPVEVTGSVSIDR